ncbi:bifunctional metallophosphatase/5'-nucleotidase [Alicyclobacillus fodiniaquatilis]|uniref:Bifunctional metallophosphatase/5'-nucleotidase n=1 Tax=Alicyclobacillus fodiniaquatilis TaxID=1661150 RepID=A0ABW4JD98_9BACL
MERIILKIVHTNDFHGGIERFGKIAAYIDVEKKRTKHFLYLDAGDIFSGHPIVDWAYGRPMVNLLNQMQLDAMAIGNHDFDYGQAHFEANRQLSRFPWLGANIVVKDQDIPISQPRPFQLFAFDECKVGVVSVTEAPPSTVCTAIAGLQFLDPVETLRYYQALRDQVDILIALTHVGIDCDRQIAQQVEGYDLIIGGHSHTVVELEPVNGTPIINTGAFGEFLGDLTIHYNVAARRIEKMNSALISVDALQDVDEGIQRQVEQYFRDSRDVLDREIGVTTGLSIDNIHHQDAPLGNFYADALRHCTKADIAFVNNGGIRLPIPQGIMTIGQLYKVAPFRNQMVVVEMTGEAIAEVIRYSFANANRIDLQTSGLTYKIWTDETGKILDVELFHAGAPFCPQMTYRVVINDYIASGGSGYEFKGCILQHAAGEMTNALVRYAAYCAEKNGVIEAKSEGRIMVQTVCDRRLSVGQV